MIRMVYQHINLMLVIFLFVELRVQDNKVAKVYDWDPATRELLLTFEIDELAFIDGGIPSTEDSIVQFDAGVANSSDNSDDPHVVRYYRINLQSLHC